MQLCIHDMNVHFLLMYALFCSFTYCIIGKVTHNPSDNSLIMCKDKRKHFM